MNFGRFDLVTLELFIAIAERLHEPFPYRGIWPTDARLRAQARLAAAEMYSGFRALRGAMPMNKRGRYPGKRRNEIAAKGSARVNAVWATAKRLFLFGKWFAADALYAPVATRFVNNGVELEGAAREYQRALLDSPEVTTPGSRTQRR